MACLSLLESRHGHFSLVANKVEWIVGYVQRFFDIIFFKLCKSALTITKNFFPLLLLKNRVCMICWCVITNVSFIENFSLQLQLLHALYSTHWCSCSWYLRVTPFLCIVYIQFRIGELNVLIGVLAEGMALAWRVLALL